MTLFFGAFYFYHKFLFVLSVLVQIIGMVPDNNKYIVYIKDNARKFPKAKHPPGKWPPRDTEFILYYIPDFSPIVGHLWMINVIRHRDSNTLSQYLDNPVWRGLNEKWVTKYPIS